MAVSGELQSVSRKPSEANGSQTSEAEKKPPRTIEQIEADLARDREELSATLDALKVELDPRTQAEHLKTFANEKAAVVREQAASAYDAVGARAKQFADDVVERRPSALAIVAGVTVAVVLVVVVVARRSR